MESAEEIKEGLQFKVKNDETVFTVHAIIDDKVYIIRPKSNRMTEYPIGTVKLQFGIGDWTVVADASQSQCCGRWVKASERLPEIDKDVCFRLNGYIYDNGHYTGFYVVLDHFGSKVNEVVEWLDESSPCQCQQELEKYKGVLDGIMKWEFATDGRKFGGDHKGVLKHIISFVKENLNE